MQRVAYLTSSDMVPGGAAARADLFELEHQLAAVVPACRARGLELELCVWDAPATAQQVAAGRYAAVVVGTPWDYHGRAETFLSQVDRFATAAPVWNPPRVMRWNTHKSYLRDLERAGVRCVPTAWVDRVDAETVAAAHRALGAEHLVAKPIVGAGAERQVRLRRGAPLPPAADGPPAAALLQPFVPSVQTEGELSLVFCGGRYSHALVKRPAAGDYRVQSVYGGREVPYEPTPAERSTAERALAAVPGCVPADLLYARVDLVRATDGGLMLMELELIEPYLYPEQGPELGAHFARALAARLELA